MPLSGRRKIRGAGYFRAFRVAAAFLPAMRRFRVPAAFTAASCLFSVRAFRVAAAFLPAARRFRVFAAFLPAARLFRVCAAFCPAVSSTVPSSCVNLRCASPETPEHIALRLAPYEARQTAPCVSPTVGLGAERNKDCLTHMH